MFGHVSQGRELTTHMQMNILTLPHSTPVGWGRETTTFGIPKEAIYFPEDLSYFLSCLSYLFTNYCFTMKAI